MRNRLLRHRPACNRVPVLALLLLSALAGRSAAEVTRFEITERTTVAGGQSFGEVGAYEQIVGRVYYSLDPVDPANRAIIDLPLAPRDAQERVNFTADLFILAPAELSRANGTLLYDVNNRGNKLALRFFNDAPGSNHPSELDDFGHGFLLRKGFIIVWSGWDGELLPGDHRLQLAAPKISTGKTHPMNAMVRCEFVPSSATTRSVVNWDNHGSYRPTEQGMQSATLTVREKPHQPRRTIARDRWKLIVHEVESKNGQSQLPSVEVEMAEGLLPGHLYELLYEAQDPLVMGCGFTAVRDLMAALKHGEGEHNPLLVDGRAAANRAIGFGVSQSGRFLREFVYWGMNRDERERKVFDAVIPHVAGGGLGSFNHRFAQPTRHAAQHDHYDYPPDRFPFTYETQIDPYTGEEDGIFQRTPAESQPLVIHTQSSAEYWTRSGSLVHTDPKGRVDARPPDNLRIFAFGGTQHGPADFPPGRGNGKNLNNPGDYRPFLRALLMAVNDSMEGAAECPPSIYPKIQEGTLVDWRAAATGFPEIPGIAYPLIIRQPPVLNFGRRWDSERIVDRQPPQIMATYRTLVPRVNSDGNELGCLLPPEVSVPTGTYTGWNLRTNAAGAEDQLVSLVGSYIPFARTRDERQTSGDPRASIEERYSSLDDYMKRLEAACDELMQQRLLLDEDKERILARQRERVATLFE